MDKTRVVEKTVQAPPPSAAAELNTQVFSMDDVPVDVN